MLINERDLKYLIHMLMLRVHKRRQNEYKINFRTKRVGSDWRQDYKVSIKVLHKISKQNFFLLVIAKQIHQDAFI